eukprot:128687_1
MTNTERDIKRCITGSSIDTNIRGIVAIDFGTDGIALAYCEITEQKQCHFIECEGRYVISNSKNKNNVLLTRDGKFITFGSVALETYLNYDSSSSSDSSYDSSNSSSDNDEYIDAVETNLRNRHSELLFYGYCRHAEIAITRMIPEEVMKLIYSYNPSYTAKISKKLAKTPMLFESIKTALYDENISDAIRCVDGRMCSTSTVFVAVFKYIKQTVFNFFRKHNIEIKNIKEEIKWILTVPAIWSDLAKYKMEKWALDAGLINGSNPDDLRFVYESDCTLISCQYDAKNQVLDGERCIVIDAGAGIVDIGCYQIDGKHAREIYVPTGSLCGGNMVDLQFEQLLYEIFGRDAVLPFKLNHAYAYMNLIKNFRKSKKQFYNEPNAKFHAVSLISWFVVEMRDYYDEVDDFDNFIDNARPFGLGKDHLRLDADTLLISCAIWKKMFDKVINPMIDHVKNLITIVNQIKDRDNRQKKVKYLYISGGFSSSKYFQHRIEQVFGINSSFALRIAMAVKPQLSVIDGAMKLVCNPKYISGRILKYTYGISVDRREKNVDMSKLPKGYLDEFRRNTYFHPNTRQRIVRNLFSVIARKNSLIGSDQYIEKQYRRFSKMEKMVKILLYYSKDMDPYVVGDNKLLVSVIITFPEDYNELRFKVLFYFGGTKISARVVFTNGNMYQLKLQYE